MSLTEKIPNCIFIPHSKLYAFAWISNRQPPACIPRDSWSVVPASQNLLKWGAGHGETNPDPLGVGGEPILSVSLASLGSQSYKSQVQKRKSKTKSKANQ